MGALEMPSPSLSLRLTDSRQLEHGLVVHRVGGGRTEGDAPGSVEAGGALVRLDRGDGSARVELTVAWRSDAGGAALQACGLLVGGALVAVGRIDGVVVRVEGRLEGDLLTLQAEEVRLEAPPLRPVALG